jgi:uncharacterized protein
MPIFEKFSQKKMLVQFTVANFRSVSSPMTLSMEPTAISDFPENILKEGKRKLLVAAGLYGANSSGKSNFLLALHEMQRIIISSFNASAASKLGHDPFLKQAHRSTEPTYFEAVFLQRGKRYRYGFEYDASTIVSEWLFETEKRIERTLFLRSKDTIEVFPHFEEGEKLEYRTRANALFLTVVDQFNGPIAGEVSSWFYLLKFIDGLDHNSARESTATMLQGPTGNQRLMEFYKKLDLGFEGIRVESGELLTQQRLFESDGQDSGSMIEFDARTQESSGTNKVIDLSGQLMEALELGHAIIVDEFDAKLHPLLTLAILRLFQNPESNRKGAQLIFATHDSNLLRFGNLRRDQIYFTEKDKIGATQLYSLVEYGGVRKDRSFEKDYLQGRYGAIPFIA